MTTVNLSLSGGKMEFVARDLVISTLENENNDLREKLMALVGAVSEYLEHSTIALEGKREEFLYCAECKSMTDEHTPWCKAHDAYVHLKGILDKLEAQFTPVEQPDILYSNNASQKHWPSE